MQIRFKPLPNFSFLQFYLHNLILIPVIISYFDANYLIFFTQ